MQRQASLNAKWVKEVAITSSRICGSHPNVQTVGTEWEESGEEDTRDGVVGRRERGAGLWRLERKWYISEDPDPRARMRHRGHGARLCLVRSEVFHKSDMAEGGECRLWKLSFCSDRTEETCKALWCLKQLWGNAGEPARWVTKRLLPVTSEHTPVVDSCQCIAKPIQYCKVISLQLK